MNSSSAIKIKLEAEINEPQENIHLDILLTYKPLVFSVKLDIEDTY